MLLKYAADAINELAIRESVAHCTRPTSISAMARYNALRWAGRQHTFVAMRVGHCDGSHRTVKLQPNRTGKRR